MTDRPRVDFGDFSCAEVPVDSSIVIDAGWECHTTMILNPLRTVVVTANLPDARVGDLATLTESFYDPPRVTEFKVVEIEPDYPPYCRRFTFEEVRR